MKSPFPGMDPYLEGFWRDVHQRLCIYSADAIQPQIRPALLARVEKRLVVETDEAKRSIYPDVRIFQKRPELTPAGSDFALGIAEPLEITLRDEVAYEGFIQILDPAAGGALVTVIEFLSISNKKSKPGISDYRAKQQEAIEAGVSVVEIDLLRGGEWVLQVDAEQVPMEMRRPCRVCVQLGWKPGSFRYYHFPLQERLLKLPIPLREGEKEALLDLQEIVDRTYENGAYDSINYDLPLLPAFDDPTAQWARKLIENRKSN